MVWWTDQRFQELTGFDSETTQNVKNACNQQFANNLPQLDGASLRLKESQAIVTQCISTALQLSLAPHQQAVPSAAKKHLRMLATMWVRDDKRAKQRTREQSLPGTAYIHLTHINADTTLEQKLQICQHHPRLRSEFPVNANAVILLQEQCIENL